MISSSLRFNGVSASGARFAAVWLWAALGLVVTVFSFTVLGRWVASPDQFLAVPIPAEAMPAPGVLRLRLLEALSLAIAAGALGWFLVRPWLRTGRAPILGLTMIGALISYVLDTTVNYGGYWMAWNAHSVNVGTWAAFFPGHRGPVRYAEGLLWGPPMYVYFGVVLGSIQLAVFTRLRPVLGGLGAAVLSFAVAFAFDFIAEVAIIRSTEAYAWAQVVGALSVWPGTLWQFPLYESLMVAVYASLYVLLLRSVHAAGQGGESFIERGVGALPSAWQLPLRAFASFGFAFVPTAIYFAGFNLFSLQADTAAPLPAYLLPAG